MSAIALILSKNQKISIADIGYSKFHCYYNTNKSREGENSSADVTKITLYWVWNV